MTGIDTINTIFGSRQVSAIKTNKGTIKTKCVVNCTGNARKKITIPYCINIVGIGAWAPYIGAMVDVSVPLVVTKHAYVVTEKIDGISGMPNVRDHDSSLYFKLQGDALSFGGYENDPIFIDKV